MATDQTGTYQLAKSLYGSLKVNQRKNIKLSEYEAKILRKHLLEMVKRKETGERYVTRHDKDSLMIMRLQ
jgi:hypothetical protein